MRYIFIFLLCLLSAQADLLVQPTPRPATQTAVTVKLVLLGFNDFLGNAPARLKRIQDLVWNTPGVAPCDIVVALGTDAAQVLRAASGAVSFLNAVSPGLVPVPSHPGYTITPRSDGSATCVAPTPSP